MDFIPSKYISWIIIFIIIYATFRLFKSQNGIPKFFAGILLIAVSLSAFSNVGSGATLWLLALVLAYRDVLIDWCWNIAGFTRNAIHSIKDSFHFSPKIEEGPAKQDSYDYERTSDNHTSSEQLRDAQRQAQRARQEAERAKQEAQQAREKAHQAEQRARRSRQQASHPADNRSVYEILGVQPGASQDEIKQAYRQLRSKYHSDRPGKVPERLKEAADKEMAQINKAYDKLKKR